VNDWSGNPIKEIEFDYCIVGAGIGNGVWKQPFATWEERKANVRERYEQLK